jgi:hypothetical protein
MIDTEETVRHLFAVATEDVPPGIDLLRGVQTRSRRRTAQIRIAISAGTAAVVAAAGAVTLSAVQAPSALAQVTNAAKATAGQSYHVRSVSRVVKGSGRVTLNGEFDPARGVGEETSSTGSQVRFTGGYMYLSLLDSFRVAYEKAIGSSIPAAKSWVRFAAPLRPGGAGTLINLTQLGIGTPDLGQVGPQDLLGLLQSVSQVSQTGPASGDGWTGTGYAFTFTKDFGGPLDLVLKIKGTVDVDRQGRVRQLAADYTIGKSEQRAEMTFGDFGAPVSVSAPPPSEVYVPHPHGGTVGFGLKPKLSPSPSGSG